MARTKQLNLILHYGGTPYHINDLGEAKSPRFELYNTDTQKVISKSNNPLDFHEYMNKIYQEMEGDSNVSEPVEKEAKRTRKTAKNTRK